MPLLLLVPGHVWTGVSYVFLYTLVVVFAMLRNALGIPYSWLIRPRIIVYLALAIEVLFLSGTDWAVSVNPLIWLVNAVLAVKLITGFWRLKNHLQQS